MGRGRRAAYILSPASPPASAPPSPPQQRGTEGGARGAAGGPAERRGGGAARCHGDGAGGGAAGLAQVDSRDRHAGGRWRRPRGWVAAPTTGRLARRGRLAATLARSGSLAARFFPLASHKRLD